MNKLTLQMHALKVPHAIQWAPLVGKSDLSLLLEIANCDNWIIKLTNLRGWKCEIRWRADLDLPNDVRDLLQLLGGDNNSSDDNYVCASRAVRGAWLETAERLEDFWREVHRRDAMNDALNSGDTPALKLMVGGK